MENIKNEAVSGAESHPSQDNQDGIGTQTKVPDGDDLPWNISENETEKGLKDSKPSPHCKKVMKHALRQQAKRRRKNTTIAAGNPAPIQRHTLSPSTCDVDEVSCETACYRQPTMAEVLASIPGFSVKPRRRSQKKLSAAAQLEQTKEGCVDLESPDSILVHSNLRALLNKHTFSALPSLYQYKLLQLLPHVDRTGSDSVFRLSGSGLNNEFFARACLDWRERLAEGEFTPENQAKIKAEQEKEKSKLDPWKLKHFEPTWGESLREWPSTPTSTASRPQQQPRPVKQTTPPTRLRTVGAVTRAVTSYREKRAALSPPRQLDPKRNRTSDPDKPENESRATNDCTKDVVEETNTISFGEPKTENNKKEKDIVIDHEAQASTVTTDDLLDSASEAILSGKTKSEIDYIILPREVERISPNKDRSELSDASGKNGNLQSEGPIEEALITVSFVSDEDTIKANYKCSKSPVGIVRSPSQEEMAENQDDEVHSSPILSPVSPNTKVSESSSSCGISVNKESKSGQIVECKETEQSPLLSETFTVNNEEIKINEESAAHEKMGEKQAESKMLMEDYVDLNTVSQDTNTNSGSEDLNDGGNEQSLEETGIFQNKHRSEVLKDDNMHELNMQLVQQNMLENNTNHLSILEQNIADKDAVDQNQIVHQNNQNGIIPHKVMQQQIETSQVTYSHASQSHHVPQLIQSSHVQQTQLLQQLGEGQLLNQEDNQNQIHQQDSQSQIHQQNNQSQIHQQNNQPQMHQLTNQSQINLQDNHEQQIHQQDNQNQIHQQGNQSQIHQQDIQPQIHPQANQSQIHQQHHLDLNNFLHQLHQSQFIPVKQSHFIENPQQLNQEQIIQSQMDKLPNNQLNLLQSQAIDNINQHIEHGGNLEQQISQSLHLQQQIHHSGNIHQQFNPPSTLQQQFNQSENLQQQINQSENFQQQINQSGTFQQQITQSGTMQQQINQSVTMHQQVNQSGTMHQHMNQPGSLQQMNQSNSLQQQMNQSNSLQQQMNQSTSLQQQMNQSSSLQQQMNQSGTMQEQINQPGLLQQQINQTGSLQQQMNQSAMLQQQISQSSTLQQQINQSTTLQPHINQSASLHQHVNHSGSVQQQIEQSGSIQHQIDPLVKSNVLMLPQVVLDVTNTPGSDHSSLSLPVSVKKEESLADMNTVVTIPASNEQSLSELRVVNESTMSNVPVMNEVILPDIPGNQLLPERPTVTDEKWEVIQVNPDKNEGIYFKEDEAAILAAAWDVVGSSTHFQDLQPPVSVIPCQEEIEVRLQESSLPAPQWVDYSAASDKQSSGHVKLELEVTLTPEVDSQVSSSSAEAGESVRVIPPTTIVCLPPLTASAPPPPPPPPASSSAIPYLALTTSTPVRAVPAKPLQTKSGGRGGRGSNNKPPPGAVNFERSYQICQAVIQNSPNRHQLRCQLKPPPALLGKKPNQQPPRQRPRQQAVVLRHVLTSSSGGIPVSMAVLPTHPTHMGGVRRSNSAPPTHSESQGCGGRGRPASVGGPGLSCGGCSLRPLVPCRRCGDFCHEDCITPARLCVTCHSA